MNQYCVFSLQPSKQPHPTVQADKWSQNFWYKCIHINNLTQCNLKLHSSKIQHNLFTQVFSTLVYMIKKAFFFFRSHFVLVPNPMLGLDSAYILQALKDCKDTANGLLSPRELPKVRLRGHLPKHQISKGFLPF